MNVAVIPARGGSKRIPRKNLREFAGQPVIAYSIHGALQSGLFDRVIVSTDDPEIAQAARDFGAEVPFVRPAALSDDYAGTVEVIAHAIEWLDAERPIALAAVCCIYATAPLLSPEDLRAGLALLDAGGWQYVFSATAFSYPVFRSFRRGVDNRVEMLFPEMYRVRSQDLPTVMHDAGQFYWGRPSAWTNRTPIIGPGSTFVSLPSWRVQDIDTMDDWERAEKMFSLLNSSAEKC